MTIFALIGCISLFVLGVLLFSNTALGTSSVFIPIFAIVLSLVGFVSFFLVLFESFTLI